MIILHEIIIMRIEFFRSIILRMSFTTPTDDPTALGPDLGWPFGERSVNEVSAAIGPARRN
jgi:hypothetical protein